MSSLSTNSLWTSDGNSSDSSISAARERPIFSSTISRTSRRNSSSSSGSANRPSFTLGSARAANDQGVALAATAAQRRAPEINTAPPHLVGQRQHQPGAAHSDGVTKSHGAAVHVHYLLVDPEHPRGVQGHGGEGLVDLDQPEVVHVLAGLLQRVVHG